MVYSCYINSKPKALLSLFSSLTGEILFFFLPIKIRLWLVQLGSSNDTENNWCGAHGELRGPDAKPVKTCFCSPGYEGDGFYCAGKEIIVFFKTTKRPATNFFMSLIHLSASNLTVQRASNQSYHILAGQSANGQYTLCYCHTTLSLST